MTVTGRPGAKRAWSLLNGVPDRFNEFCHMDQITFVQLADWMCENWHSDFPDITIEESLFVFLDIVAQGNSFRGAACSWHHDVEITQALFLTIMDGLQMLLEKENVSPSCPSFNTNKSRWRILKSQQFRRAKSNSSGMVKIGDDGGDGLEISQERLMQALKALNNFIHEHKEF